MDQTTLVITTINPPTRAIKEFLAHDEFDLLVVGDMKTPDADYAHLAGATFFSFDDQRASRWSLANLVPPNHYCRKNLGYLEAIAQGATQIADSDDDNVPRSWWGTDVQLGSGVAGSVPQPSKFVNAYAFACGDQIWPRGYPLTRLTEPQSTDAEEAVENVLVWQGLADNDPDVDAIHRLVFGSGGRYFDHISTPIVLPKGSYCPFNSQNTFWHSAAFVYLYLPMFVRFRFTDILRSYVAQRGLWALGGRLAFGGASVEQDRNEHDLLADFRDEIDCYTRVEDIVERLDSCRLSGEPFKDIAHMYEALAEIGVIEGREVTAVESWVQDVHDAQEVAKSA